jgi:integrase
MKFTETELKNLQPGPTRYIVHDEQQTGLALRVSPSGRKTFAVLYREPGQRRMQWRTLGAWPALKLATAREAAAKLIAEVRLGITPHHQKTGGTPAAEVFKLWEASWQISKGETANRRSRWKRHIGPAIGKRGISTLTRQDIEALTATVAANYPTTARGVLGDLSLLMDFAEGLGVRKDSTNPAAKVRPPRLPPKSRPRLDVGTWPAFAAAVDDAIANRRFELLHAELFKILLLTGARKSEWMSARWDMLDATYPALDLGRGHKTGRQSEAYRRIEIGPEAWRLLMGLPRRGDQIFYGRGGVGRITSTSKPWAEILRHGEMSDLTVHGLRRSFAGAARSDGMTEPDVGILLGHAASVTGIYAEAELKTRQELVCQAEKAVMRRMYMADA